VSLDPVEFDLRIDGRSLAGETGGEGEGPAIALLHGLTATRRYVTHGSRTLARSGMRTIAYDARGHGESDAAPAGGGYTYDELAADLGSLLDEQSPKRRCILAGHSMGAHTLAAFALAAPDRVAAIVAIGPTWLGGQVSPESLSYWNALADGVERDGVDGFLEAYDDDLNPEWRDTILRITRERLSRHLHLDAIAQALREVPASRPFDDLSELEFLDVPALVVASHDEADPGHPYAVAEAYAEALPAARLISEDEGESPLAWQGGKLSREIAAFAAEEAVQERLEAS
jgi:pimeloyl-ACP methyl ester carboxylesterase